MRTTHARAACLTAVATLAVLVPAPADAFPPRGYDCPLRSPKIWFNLVGSEWNGSGAFYGAETYGDVAERAFPRWVIPEHRDGTSIARMSPEPFDDARQVDVYFRGEKDGSIYGAQGGGGYLCNGDDIWVDPDIQDKVPSKLETLLVHEMGHALGLDHTGTHDSQYLGRDGIPVMSTCHGYSTTIPRNDDHAALTYAHAIGAERTLTADYGFEAGLRFFSASGAQPQHVTGSTSGGDYHIQVVPNSSLDNIAQTINFSAGAGKVVVASMQYATPGATTGNVRVELWSRPVTYGPEQTADCDDQYRIPNVDMNSRTPSPNDLSGWSLVRSNTYPLSNTWRVAKPTSGYYVVPTVPNGSVDLRIRVYTSAGTGGSYVHTHYDDVRIQEY